MEFFHIWGQDFIKMRCICKKTKSAYMAQVSRSALIEKNFESKPVDYIEKSKQEAESFKNMMRDPSE